MLKKYIYKFLPLTLFFVPGLASAHEAYVLPAADFQEGLKHISLRAFESLKDPSNLKICLLISIGIAVALALNLFFAQTQNAEKITGWLERLSKFGPILVRISIASAWFF
jgi:hypothetical protein